MHRAGAGETMTPGGNPTVDAPHDVADQRDLRDKPERPRPPDLTHEVRNRIHAAQEDAVGLENNELPAGIGRA